jgi:hypothetical protein
LRTFLLRIGNSGLFSSKNIYLLGGIFCLMLSSCSVERNNVFSKSYHNTTARYNGYFLAKEKMKEVQLELRKNHKEDYNKILPIYYPLNTKSSAAVNPMLEEIIKKASLPIQRHKNSRWIEESYILIGRSRYYKQDYGNAIETFKYVNTVSKNDNDRHAALVQLLLTFIADNQMNNATAVVDYLNKEQIGKRKVKRDFFKAKGYYFFVNSDYPRSILNLRRAEYLTYNKDERARLHFIIGQLYQATNKNNAAYVHYKLCLRRGPEYELGFYAKLYMAQSLELERKDGAKRINRYFRKLLKDKKNLEYRDKIYYEMAKFELKRDQVSKSMDYLKQSLAVSTNPIQKGYSYLLAGEIAYERLREFELSKFYYDSAVNNLDKTLPQYPEIVKRQKVLEEFVAQLKIIRTEDSLQALANLDTTSLKLLIEKKVREEIARFRLQKEQEKKAAVKEKAFGGIGDQGAGSGPSKGGFYFNDPSQIARGKSDFSLRWGARPLEDNWRRLNKEKLIPEETNPEEPESKEEGSSIVKSEKEQMADEETKLEASIRKQFLKDIPKDNNTLEASNARLSKALYTIGKIYDQKLKEPENAVIRFEELIRRFPDYEKEAEVFYYLYLLLEKRDAAKAEYYKQQLLSKYKNSSYAQRLINPNYIEESRATNSLVKAIYKEAYSLYSDGYYHRSDSIVALALQNYPINDLKDRLTLLRALNSAKLENLVIYKSKLLAFTEEYKNSELVPYAKQLILSTEEFINQQIADKSKKTASPETKTVEYKKEDDKPHRIVIAYSNNDIAMTDQINGLATFNDLNFSSEQLKINQMIFNDVYRFIVVKDFENKSAAMVYREKLTVLETPLSGLRDSDYTTFAISESNFFTMLKSKRLDDYMSFFREQYY